MTSVQLKKGLSFRKSDRILNASDFTAVFNNANYKASHQYFLILAVPNSLDYPRLGLVIAKKNIRLATKRNKLKRLIRESFRLKQHKLPGIDAIVLARRSSGDANNSEITQCLDKLWKRITERAAK